MLQSTYRFMLDIQKKQRKNIQNIVLVRLSSGQSTHDFFGRTGRVDIYERLSLILFKDYC